MLSPQSLSCLTLWCSTLNELNIGNIDTMVVLPQHNLVTSHSGGRGGGGGGFNSSPGIGKNCSYVTANYAWFIQYSPHLNRFFFTCMLSVLVGMFCLPH